jgi:hypothetical protein
VRGRPQLLLRRKEEAMSAPCCGGGSTNGGAASPRRSTIFGRIIEAIRWITPGVLLALIPKCPMCLAAYIALFTGLGLSFETAEWLRWIFIGLCVLALVYLAATRGRRGILRLLGTHRT